MAMSISELEEAHAIRIAALAEGLDIIIESAMKKNPSIVRGRTFSITSRYLRGVLEEYLKLHGITAPDDDEFTDAMATVLFKFTKKGWNIKVEKDEYKGVVYTFTVFNGTLWQRLLRRIF